MRTDPDCVFCEIVAGREPASVFYEDAYTLGFMTIGPVNPGHALVIPREHAIGLQDLDEDNGQRMWTVSHRAVAAIRSSGLRREGVNLFLADGEAAVQEVFHVHMHVFPRFAGDPFRVDADWDVNPARSELDETAQMIRHSYERLWSMDQS